MVQACFQTNVRAQFRLPKNASVRTVYRYTKRNRLMMCNPRGVPTLRRRRQGAGTGPQRVSKFPAPPRSAANFVARLASTAVVSLYLRRGGSTRAERLATNLAGRVCCTAAAAAVAASRGRPESELLLINPIIHRPLANVRTRSGHLR